jgi:DNA/RNA endonuclease YhcR with UshA esterase domain
MIMKNNVFAIVSIMIILFVSGSLIGETAQKTIPINTIDQKIIDQIVTVGGRIVSVLAPRSEQAPYSIYLTDDTESIRIVVWKNVYDALTIKEKLKADARVSVTGTVKDYRGNLNIYVNAPTDIRMMDGGAGSGKNDATKTSAVTPAPVAPAPAGIFSPGQVNASMLEKTVTVQGVVKAYTLARSERSPYSVDLKDDAGVLRVVYWSDVAKSLSFAPAPGQTLRITGQVSEYRGNLQLRVRGAADIKQVELGAVAPAGIAPAVSPAEAGTTTKPLATNVTPAPAVATPASQVVAPAQILSPGSITKESIGKTVKVKGKIVNIRPSWMETAPNTVSISDGAGTIDYVYWPDVDAKLTAEQKPVVGKIIIVEGEVSEFRGKLQVRVKSPEKITF